MATLIGLTGGIATGKSTVSKMFIASDIPVIDADKIAKSLLDPQTEEFKKLVRLCGEEVLTTSDEINRNKLAKMIFNDEKIREKVNAIIHPRVKTLMFDEVKRLKDFGKELIVLDVPLLFEAGFDKLVDVTVVVYARKKDQVERLIIRDNIDEKFALKKIKAQFPLAKKKELADYIIDNSKSILDTRKSFDRVLKKIGG